MHTSDRKFGGDICDDHHECICYVTHTRLFSEISLAHTPDRALYVYVPGTNLLDLFCTTRTVRMRRAGGGLGGGGGEVVCWLLNVPATCECIWRTDLLRQFYVLPH